MLRDLLETGDLLQIFATFIALAFIVATVLCLVFIIYGGITFILSAGNEDRIKKAVHTIRFAIIGLFVTIGAIFLVSIMSKLLAIPFPLNFDMIIQLMQEIFSAISSSGNS